MYVDSWDEVEEHCQIYLELNKYLHFNLAEK